MKPARFEFARVRDPTPDEEAISGDLCRLSTCRRGDLGSRAIQSRQNSTIRHVKDGS
jgi:hypothetical protein